MSDDGWTAFWMGLPSTIAALAAAYISLRTYAMASRTSDRVGVIEKQGNSTAEASLRTRLSLAERNYAETHSEANRIEVESASTSLRAHLDMQARVDAKESATSPE